MKSASQYSTFNLHDVWDAGGKGVSTKLRDMLDICVDHVRLSHLDTR